MTKLDRNTAEKTLVGYLEYSAQESSQVKNAIVDRSADRIMRYLGTNGTFRRLLAEAMEITGAAGEFSECNSAVNELRTLHAAFDELKARFKREDDLVAA